MIIRNQMLFNYLANEHGVSLLESELSEVERICNQTGLHGYGSIIIDRKTLVPVDETEILRVLRSKKIEHHVHLPQGKEKSDG